MLDGWSLTAHMPPIVLQQLSGVWRFSILLVLNHLEAFQSSKESAPQQRNYTREWKIKNILFLFILHIQLHDKMTIRQISLNMLIWHRDISLNEFCHFFANYNFFPLPNIFDVSFPWGTPIFIDNNVYKQWV